MTARAWKTGYRSNTTVGVSGQAGFGGSDVVTCKQADVICGNRSDDPLVIAFVHDLATRVEIRE